MAVEREPLFVPETVFACTYTLYIMYVCMYVCGDTAETEVAAEEEEEKAATAHWFH